MPHYRVRLTKEVTDSLDAFVVVEAENEDAASDAALAIVNSGETWIDWQLAHADAEGGTPPEVDSVTECDAPEPEPTGGCRWKPGALCTGTGGCVWRRGEPCEEHPRAG